MSWWSLKPIHFPECEPVLKMKHGLWYRPNNCGYSNTLLEAGLYDRADALDYCFGSDGKNGYCEVIAVPLREAMRSEGWTAERIKAYEERLAVFRDYAAKV